MHDEGDGPLGQSELHVMRASLGEIVTEGGVYSPPDGSSPEEEGAGLWFFHPNVHLKPILIPTHTNAE